MSITAVLPEAFTSYTTRLLGEAEADSLYRAIAEPPVVSIRTNPLKPVLSAPHEQQPRQPLQAVPWAEEGYYLSERPQFTLDPTLHAGAYYVQEASSMALAALRPMLAEAPLRMLDLCAAPGGKSTLWRSIMPEGSLLVANEPMPQRAKVLAENITKWGHADVAVTCAYPQEFAPFAGFFDVIVADVPCSGEGMFRKDSVAIDEWSAPNVEACRMRQRSIISDVWPALREGGLLVYSTCTYNAYENEDNVDYICRTLGAEPVAVQLPTDCGIITDLLGSGRPSYRFMPHRTRGEGFFFAVLRKTAGTSGGKLRLRSAAAPRVSLREARNFTTWLRSADAFTLKERRGCIVAERQAFSDVFDLLHSHMRVLGSGVSIALPKGKGWQPAHALSMSADCDRSAFGHAEVSGSEALRYLRGESITLAPDVERGFVMLTYRGLPLGFVNNIGSRTNNMYPEPWRIRSSYGTEAVGVI